MPVRMQDTLQPHKTLESWKINLPRGQSITVRICKIHTGPASAGPAFEYIVGLNSNDYVQGSGRLFEPAAG